MKTGQPVPDVSSADVERVIIRDFGISLLDDLTALLNQYADSEADRVKLAILKLSNGDIEELKHCLEMTKVDYRDVLLYAEYPHCAKVRLDRLTDREKAEIFRKDWLQYRQWLDR